MELLCYTVSVILKLNVSQGFGVSWSDAAESLQADPPAGQQQGEAGHRSGRQTEA